MPLMAKGLKSENTDELNTELKAQFKIFNDLLEDTYFGGIPVS